MVLIHEMCVLTDRQTDRQMDKLKIEQWHHVTSAHIIIGDKAFYITSGGGSGQHDFCHINNIINDMKFDCQLRDITENLGVLSVQGPLR